MLELNLPDIYTQTVKLSNSGFYLVMEQDMLMLMKLTN
jgi:hypothetical protein